MSWRAEVQHEHLNVLAKRQQDTLAVGRLEESHTPTTVLLFECDIQHSPSPSPARPVLRLRLTKTGRQTVVPDFCSENYHKKARATYERVKGVTLTNLLASRVFGALFREVFSGDLNDRSEKLVEDVKEFMKGVLGTLCNRACVNYPFLLNELKTNLIDEFIDWKEAETKTAVNNTLRAEIGWVFTQDRSYKETIHKVSSMVDSVRNSTVSYNAALRSGGVGESLKSAEAVGCVSQNFIAAMASWSASSYESSIYDLQASVPLTAVGCSVAS